jgi:hypothetical protein
MMTCLTSTSALLGRFCPLCADAQVEAAEQLEHSSLHSSSAALVLDFSFVMDASSKI